MSMLDTLNGWVPIDNVKPSNGMRFDLLVLNGFKWREVPDCFWNAGARFWQCNWRDRDGLNPLIRLDRIHYARLRGPWPDHLEPHRRNLKRPTLTGK